MGESLDEVASSSGMFNVVVALSVVAVLVALRVHQFIYSLICLVDLLFTVKLRARKVQRQNPEWNMADTFESCVKQYWDSEFVVVTNDKITDPSTQTDDSHGKSKMTYGEAEMGSSAVANWSKQTLKCDTDDVVALFMPSSCEFVVAMFGLVRAGVKAALVNTSLRGHSLVHALTTALGDKKIRAILVSPELYSIVSQVANELPPDVQIVEFGPNKALDPWQEKRAYAWMGSRKGVRWDDTCIYIYTSGTTGLPKASKVNHMRVWSAATATNKVNQLRRSDRFYCPMPLYHTSGCALGLVACLLRGCAIVVRPKFSASKFSTDVKKYNCNSMQYIGEMARYLVVAKPNPADGLQPLRFAYGNGMPPEIWTQFQQRYNVKQVNEFYASTEGNVNIFNNTGFGTGACGIVPRGLDWVYPIGLFKLDPETGELQRDKVTGLCVPSRRGEIGELLGLIQQHDPSRRFDGYTDGKATERKVAKNVRKQGDSYFRSGDLLRQDHVGFLYFCDRVGETFRWKGENVSTSEVAQTLLKFKEDGVAFFQEAIVYGVEVEGYPGRAGMAAVVVHDDSTAMWMERLWTELQDELPRYAQPLFLRVTREIEKTTTHKYKKTKLVQESFQSCGSDVVYFRDDAAKSFVVLDESIRSALLAGDMKV
eukprot:Nitzschia sp. Nitz4//scaffold268_size26297//23927//25882//NITZ4_008284-RA/size26297-processed-gene-0.15-mRNA-1//-1//CDS//3329544951//5669//frame0